jgi:hypothetical protein
VLVSGASVKVKHNMAWERGYYYRVRRENGRVVREYLGGGRPAELIARLDALERKKGQEKRRLDAEALQNEKATLHALDADLEALIETTNLLAHAALVATGYHQHKRGEWRKRRDCPDEKR